MKNFNLLKLLIIYGCILLLCGCVKSKSNVDNNFKIEDNFDNSNIIQEDNEASEEEKDKTIESETAKVIYYCDDKTYELKNNKCVKIFSVEANKEYYCDSGYNLNGTSCTKDMSYSETFDAELTYSCNSPYELNGDKCEHLAFTNTLTRYVCSDGTYSSGMCVIKFKRTLTSDVRNWCSRMGLLGSGSCPKLGCEEVGGIFNEAEYNRDKNSYMWCYRWEESLRDGIEEKYCLSGYVLNGSRCEKLYEISAFPTYSCPDDYLLLNGKCIGVVSKMENIPAKYKYTCSSGYKLNGTVCVKEQTMSANKEYTCSKNYTLSGTTCYKK